MQQHRPRLSVAQIDTLIDALCIAANDAHASKHEALQQDPPDGDLAVLFHAEACRYERMLDKLSFPVLVDPGTPGYFDSDCPECGKRQACDHRP